MRRLAVMLSFCLFSEFSTTCPTSMMAKDAHSRCHGNVWPNNVWLGTSVESQKYVPRVHVLARLPVPIKFVSAEPLLGMVDMSQELYSGMVQWLIVGGESGPHARPMALDWARTLRDQATAANVPFFLKQLGGAGNKRGGEKAVLYGARWTELPEQLEGRLL